jgi:hypothetical protein
MSSNNMREMLSFGELNMRVQIDKFSKKDVEETKSGDAQSRQSLMKDFV